MNEQETIDVSNINPVDDSPVPMPQEPGNEQPPVHETVPEAPIEQGVQLTELDVVQQRIVTQVNDALTALQRTIAAFSFYTQQHMDDICKYYWDLILPMLAEHVPVQVIPQSELVSYNPEPDKPDGAIQIIRLPANIPATDDNIRNFGAVMCRVVSQPCHIEIDKLGINVTQSTAATLYGLLKQAAEGLFNYVISGFTDNRASGLIPSNAELLLTPLHGSCHLTDDGRRAELTLHLLYGIWVSVNT